jgi:hypothetical protein
MRKCLSGTRSSSAMVTGTRMSNQFMTLLPP